MDKIELKPCPFCNTQPGLLWMPMPGLTSKIVEVKCDKCWARSGASIVDKPDIHNLKGIGCIEQWNTRYVDQFTSDGYHTFEELYKHRYLLYIAFCLNRCSVSWIGEEVHFDGYFCLYTMIHTDESGDAKQISYHIPDEYLYLLEEKIEFRPNNYDGHTSNNVANRLIDYCNRDF